jgi:hypothetical protein
LAPPLINFVAEKWCDAENFHSTLYIRVGWKGIFRNRTSKLERCFEILYISVMKILVCLVNKRFIIKVFVTQVKFIFYCRFYFLGNISSDKYNSFRWKSQENLSFMSEKSLKSSKIEIFSWPPRPYGQLQGLGSNVFS